MARKNVAVFALKSLLAASPVLLLWAVIAFRPLWYSDGEIPNYRWNKDYCAQPHDNDVIVLGDSIANGAYLPDMLSERMVNLSLGGSAPMVGYHVLENYLSHNKVPNICYISYMEGHFATGSGTYYTRLLFSRRITPKVAYEIYNKQLDFKENPQQNNPYGNNPAETQILMLCSSPSIFLPSVKRAMYERIPPYGLREKYCKWAYQKSDLHKGSFISRNSWQNMNTQKHDATFTVSPLQDYYYRRMIALCVSKGIQVRLVKLPVNDTFWNYTEAFMDEFEAYYNGICRDFPTVTVDWFDSYGGEYCLDSNHLNLQGAVRFCTELAARYPWDFAGDGGISERTKEALADYIEVAKDYSETVALLKARLGE